jgi:serine protease
MNQKFIYIKVLLMVVVFAMTQTVVAQEADNYLEKTVVFKVKESYRGLCAENEIKYAQFNNALLELGTVNLNKIFPNKQKERVKGNVDLSLIYQLSYNSYSKEDEVIRSLKKLKLFEYIEQYVVPDLTYTPSDTLLPQQYHLNLINALNAWNITKGDTNVVIGITDTGWDPVHLDLIANVKVNYNETINGSDDDGDGYIDNRLGWDLGMNDNNALFESTSHGVHVTGLAAAVTDNITGVAGVGFDTKFLPVKISNATGILTQAYQGVVYAADHGCFIINCSWGSYGYSQFNEDVINYAIINKGCLVVAAVGNNNQTNTFYPAGYDGVLSVAATEQSDFKKNDSNFGYYVDISAPGQSVLSTVGNGYGLNSGTSMASPIVAGGAAIVKAQFPTYTNQQVAAVLRATADDLNVINPTYVDQLGDGRLNLFNGVSNVSAQFVEMITKTVVDSNNNIFEAGDTLRIVGKFTNYLASITGVNVTLSSASPFVNVVDGTTALANLNTLESDSNIFDPFLVEVLSGAVLNEEILFQITISNGVYSRNQYFTVTLNPDYINVTENQVSTTITSKGRIGFNDVNSTVGLGFVYKGEQLLYEAGLMVGDGVNRVSDVVRGTAGQDQDFSALSNVAFNPPYVSALDLIGEFNDAVSISPMDIKIRHLSYAYPNAPDDKYVIVVYDIENTGGSVLTNVYAGIFADWDIISAGLNKAGFDAARKMGYVHSMNADTVYAAIKLLSPNSVVNYSLDLDGSGGINPNDGFTTTEKYDAMSMSRNSAGAGTGKDVAHVVSSGSFSLVPGEHEVISFAIIAGDSLLDIQTIADAAQTKYLADAISVEELENENGFGIYPNPTTGLLRIKTNEVLEQVLIRNLLGEIVKTASIKEIDLINLVNGVYFVEITTAKGRFSKKLILSK